MSIHAIAAQPGVFYRRTRGAHTGEWYPAITRRGKVVTAREYLDGFTARVTKGGDRALTAVELNLYMRLKFLWPDVAVLVRHRRGFDAVTAEKWEHDRVIAVPGSMILRAVKTRPGFTTGEETDG